MTCPMLTEQVSLQRVQPEACIIGSAHAGGVHCRRVWQSHHGGPHNEETNEDRSQDHHDYDEDNEGGFCIDVGSHL